MIFFCIQNEDNEPDILVLNDQNNNIVDNNLLNKLLNNDYSECNSPNNLSIIGQSNNSSKSIKIMKTPVKLTSKLKHSQSLPRYKNNHAKRRNSYRQNHTILSHVSACSL